jgi:hypothetical protein
MYMAMFTYSIFKRGSFTGRHYGWMAKVIYSQLTEALEKVARRSVG